MKNTDVLTIKEMEEPKIKNPDDVLIEVEVASICGTDVHIIEVPPGHPATEGVILGHEYVGKVLEIGRDVCNLKSGDRVIVDPNITCGYCLYCKSGHPNMCENMTTLGIFRNGGFARYNIAPASSLFKVSSNVKPEDAIFAEPLSCVINALSKVILFPGQEVLILGAGPIGLYFLLLFKISGSSLLVVAEINSYRASFAESLGANYVIDPRDGEISKQIRKIEGFGVDICVDAIGSLMDVAISSVKRGGTVFLFGMNEKAKPKIVQNLITRNEISIFGSFISNNSYPKTIKIIESGVLPLEKLITHKISLDEILDGIEIMRSGKAIKVLVYPE